MSEREELIEQIDFLQWRKAILRRKAALVDALHLVELADRYDAEWNAASDEIGRLQSRLYEIEAGISRREKLEGAAYGRML